MQSGKLNCPITIERFTSVSDMMGGQTDTWATWKSVWAQVTPKAGRESLDEGRANATFVVVFTIYRLPGLIDADRIVWQGVPYNIRGILDTGETDLQMKVEAERGVAS
jgi:SPP1 family predicted phage head-tail adaptor